MSKCQHVKCHYFQIHTVSKLTERCTLQYKQITISNNLEGTNKHREGKTALGKMRTSESPRS